VVRIIDRLAQQGNAITIRFPRAHLKNGKWASRYSGLKTALRQFLNLEEGAHYQIEDLAAELSGSSGDIFV